MLFAISFLLFVIHTAILLKNSKFRWVGWALFALYYGVIILSGDLMRSVFDMEEGSKTFFAFIGAFYTLVPLLLAEGTGKILGTKKAA